MGKQTEIHWLFVDICSQRGWLDIKMWGKQTEIHWLFVDICSQRGWLDIKMWENKLRYIGCLLTFVAKEAG